MSDRGRQIALAGQLARARIKPASACWGASQTGRRLSSELTAPRSRWLRDAQPPAVWIVSAPRARHFLYTGV
jgi:hypothetical protein